MTTLVEVRGTILAPNLAPAVGEVAFYLSRPLHDAAGNVVVAPVKVSATLDPTGAFAVKLVATDDPALQPRGVTYLVSETLQGGGSQSYSIEVPVAAALAGLERSDIVPVIPGPPIFSYVLATALTAVQDALTAAQAAETVARVAALEAETTARVVAQAAETAARVAAQDALTVDQAAALEAETTARVAAQTTETAARMAAQEAETVARVAALEAETTARVGTDALLIPLAQRGVANGVATLDANIQIPSSQLPPIAITESFPVDSQAAMLALVVERGDVAVRSDIRRSFILRAAPASNLANWLELLTPTDAVTSVDGGIGVIVLASDAAVNVGSKRTLGTGALQALPGNDARISGSVQKTGADLISGAKTFTAANGPIITSPDGTKRFRLSVDNLGVLTTVAVP